MDDYITLRSFICNVLSYKDCFKSHTKDFYFKIFLTIAFIRFHIDTNARTSMHTIHFHMNICIFHKYNIIFSIFQMLLQVSWVRHRDIHLLTVGRYTYTSDQRFRAIHHPHSEDWILQIKYPQHRDSGIYECQISSTPHMSHFIHLNVIGEF